jgi:4-diphosphocytidyl-2-C-methyl-D-erythritol kinase
MASLEFIRGSWPAPGKLNLFLRIVGRRSDGYHLLQTVFQFIDRCDELYFEPRADGAIVREGEVFGVPPEADLTVRAARLLRQSCGTALGATIRIVKRLPQGGGLGGGSSDAATTLVALNHYWDAGRSVDELAALGIRLGADVPVFVRGRAAWAEGIGERLTPVEPPETWFVVLVPRCSVSTAEVFNDPKLTRDSKSITMLDWSRGVFGNDCERVVYRRYPEIAASSEWLGRYAQPRLTGTGACVFAALPNRETADAVLAKAPGGVSGFVARGCNRSPLQHRISSELG